MFKSKTNIILLIILLSLLSIGGYIGFKCFVPPLEAVDYSSMTQSEATAWFKEKNATEKLMLEYEYSDEIPEGKLIFQSLKEGTKITKNITLVYSKGVDPQKAKTVLPIENLKDYSTAKSYFDSNGFTNVEYTFEECDLDDKAVISIEPSEASKDEHIIVKIAGPRIYEIPSLKNKDEIEKWIKDKNIKIEYVYENSPEPENTIIKIVPMTISSGETIKVTLASTSNKVELPTNLLGISESNFLAKCKEIGLTNVVKDEKGYYSSKTKEGMLAYYMPDGLVSKDEKIVYRLSLGGYKFNKNDFNGLTVDEAENLIKDLRSRNALIDKEIELIEKESANKNLLYNCEGIDKEDFIKISCNISTTSSGETNSTAKTVDLPTNLLGISEEEFLSKCKALGLTNVVKDEKGYYSTLNKKGTIGYYEPDGKINSDQKVVYRVSLGEFKFEADNFNGKTKSELEKYVKELNDLNAKVTITTSDEASSKEDGKSFGCSGVKDGNVTKITCKVAKNSSQGSTSSEGTTAVLPTNLLGVDEDIFLEKCKSLGFTSVTKDEAGYYSAINKKGTIAYYDPDGKLDKATKIVYRLSLGPYTFNANDFNNKTQPEANALIETLNSKNAHVTLKTTNAATNDVAAGNLFNCSATKNNLDTNITCSLAISNSEGEKKSTILSADKLISYYSTSSYDETASKIKKYFADGGFTNITTTGVSSTKSVGQILSVSVDGNKSYTQGSYSLNTPISVEISNELKN